jgi:hypothetical protein
MEKVLDTSIFFFYFDDKEGISPKKRDYNGIKREVLSPITSAENDSLILLGQDSYKIMLRSNVQHMLANASAHLFEHKK